MSNENETLEPVVLSGFDFTEQVEEQSKHDKGTVVHIKDLAGREMYYTSPEGERKPVTITVVGTQSKLFKSVEAEMRKRDLGRKSFTPDALQEQGIQKLARCTLAWDGFFNQGREVPLTEENAIQFYRRFDYVRDQVAVAMDDHERFS